MVRLFFDTWLAASDEAKEAAKTFNFNATVGRDDCMFYVELPNDVSDPHKDLGFWGLWNDRSIAERHADQQLFSQITERISSSLGRDIPNKERKKLFYYAYRLAQIPPFSLRFILEEVVEAAETENRIVDILEATLSDIVSVVKDWPGACYPDYGESGYSFDELTYDPYDEPTYDPYDGTYNPYDRPTYKWRVLAKLYKKIENLDVSEFCRWYDEKLSTSVEDYNLAIKNALKYLYPKEGFIDFSSFVGKCEAYYHDIILEKKVKEEERRRDRMRPAIDHRLQYDDKTKEHYYIRLQFDAKNDCWVEGREVIKTPQSNNY